MPFRERFDAAAVELEHREGARLRYRIPSDFDPPAASGDALLGIVREAVINAARHAQASEVEIELSRSGDLHPREVVHALGDAVMRATGGKLRDDATVVCLDWYGGPPRLRVSTGGASEHHAST